MKTGPPLHAAADPAEADLIQRARAGDLAAFNKLVDLHQNAVYSLAHRIIGNATTAEDATQEAFIHAWRGIRGYRGGSFRAWLMRITANACTDEIRRQARRPARSLDTAPPGETPPDVPDPAAGPEERAIGAESRTRLEAALLRLPVDQRVAIVLCDVQGYAYDEIALAMRCSIGTVKSRIARGREKLRAELRPGAPEHPGSRERQ